MMPIYAADKTERYFALLIENSNPIHKLLDPKENPQEIERLAQVTLLRIQERSAWGSEKCRRYSFPSGACAKEELLCLLFKKELEKRSASPDVSNHLEQALFPYSFIYRQCLKKGFIAPSRSAAAFLKHWAFQKMYALYAFGEIYSYLKKTYHGFSEKIDFLESKLPLYPPSFLIPLKDRCLELQAILRQYSLSLCMASFIAYRISVYFKPNLKNSWQRFLRIFYFFVAPSNNLIDFMILYWKEYSKFIKVIPDKIANRLRHLADETERALNKTFEEEAIKSWKKYIEKRKHLSDLSSHA